MQRDRITDAARGRWHGILSAMGVASSFLSGRHGPCPFCGAGKDRFRFADKDGDGRWFCNQCGNGDGFDFVQRLRGCDFTEAARLVREQVGTAPLRSSKPVDDGDMRKALNSLWRSSKPVDDGDPVSRWLSLRVGKIIVPKSIRFCQKCRYWDADTKATSFHPAMIAMISDADGRPALLHKTYLTPDGQKAEVEKVRMLMPGTFPAGAAVRLFDASEKMGIAEGIETAFAASLLFDIPVWAALNAGALEKWQPPAGARQIIVFGDNDGNFTGQRAAFSLGQRLGREDRRVGADTGARGHRLERRSVLIDGKERSMTDCPFPARITEVVSLIADGLSAKEIAIKLGISPNTTNSYIATAMAITGVHRSTALVATALRKGWIE